MRKEDSTKEIRRIHTITKTMLPRINKILNSEQLEAVLQTLFQNRPIKIIRIIAATGRSQVTWIHIENVLNHRRMASFLSFDDLIQNFWEWLLMLEMFAASAWEINQIRECVWSLVDIGDRILCKDSNNVGVVMNRKIVPEKSKIFMVDWGQVTSEADPAYVTIV